MACCELFVTYFGLGFVGTAIALDVAIALPLGLMLLWLKLQKSDEDLREVLIPFRFK